uniref:Uncharacterized protein n=1 Tax=Aegilops tauschii subsp. strangulata TaxID=200361 RepID=A0A453PHL7_AEGTS
THRCIYPCILLLFLSVVLVMNYVLVLLAEDVGGVHHDLDADAALLPASAPRRRLEQRAWSWTGLREPRRSLLPRDPSGRARRGP